jgi:hypothetical protein
MQSIVMKTLSPNEEPRGFEGFTPERRGFSIFDESSSSEEDESTDEDEDGVEHQEALAKNKGLLKKPQYKKLLCKESLLPE